MDKLKEFITKNKKIVIPVVIVVLLLFAVGIYAIVELGTNPGAVSYTHLDVYKRQLLYTPSTSRPTWKIISAVRYAAEV